MRVAAWHQLWEHTQNSALWRSVQTPGDIFASPRAAPRPRRKKIPLSAVRQKYKYVHAECHRRISLFGDVHFQRVHVQPSCTRSILLSLICGDHPQLQIYTINVHFRQRAFSAAVLRKSSAVMGARAKWVKWKQFMFRAGEGYIIFKFVYRWSFLTLFSRKILTKTKNTWRVFSFIWIFFSNKIQHFQFHKFFAGFYLRPRPEWDPNHYI